MLSVTKLWYQKRPLREPVKIETCYKDWALGCCFFKKLKGWGYSATVECLPKL